MGNLTALPSLTVDLFNSMNLPQSEEERAYVWIYSAISRSSEKLIQSNIERFSKVFNSESEVNYFIDHFESSAADLEIQIDQWFFERPFDLELFSFFEDCMANKLKESGCDYIEIDEVIIQLRQFFVEYLYSL